MYLRIDGAITLDKFARCHFTQELYRMKWAWEVRCTLEECDTVPNPLYGNWETPDGKRFFCQWTDECPPCEDSLRSPCPHGDDAWEDDILDVGAFDYYP